MAQRGKEFSGGDERFMRRALELAQRGFGGTSPNPLVGAVIVRRGRIVAEGWHERAGEGHAEARALANARRKGVPLRGATLYVTLEPCSTHGRTPPCTGAVIQSGIQRVVAAAEDPNPRHAGAGFDILRNAGIEVETGLCRDEARRLNETFNHWVVTRTPFVILKSAMSLDGRIATNSGESKWITGEKARAFGMRLRLGADAIIAGVNTVIRDDPALTLRPVRGVKIPPWKVWRRIILDPQGRTPLSARVLNDRAAETILVISKPAAKRAGELESKARVWIAPSRGASLDLSWVLRKLGAEDVTSVVVEGGGETHARFLSAGLAHRVCFFYAPLIISGRAAPKSVAGSGTLNKPHGIRLAEPEWKMAGRDFLLTGLIERSGQKPVSPERMRKKS